MNLSDWFRSQLKTSADGVMWATTQVPRERLYTHPPKQLGDWVAARHVFHLWFYEQMVAVPSMRQWLGAPIPALENVDEDLAWNDGKHEIQRLLTKFQAVRDEQIDLVARFDEAAWHQPHEAVWGPVTLLWVVSKTYQHTAEHTNDILRIALFWDFFAADQKQAGST